MNIQTGWIPITDISQLSEIAESSNHKPAAIFKHSTTCGISRMALRNFEREFDAGEIVDIYFLDLLANRNISNAIAEQFGVRHQSPQLILLKNGKPVYYASHDEISADQLKKEL